MARPKEAPSNIIVFSPGWKTCIAIREAIRRVLSLHDIPYNFILFSADMKTGVAVRTGIRRAISFISEYQEEDNFFNVLFDEAFMEEEKYSLKLARAISYLTAKSVFVCRGGNIIEVTQDGNTPVLDVPFQCDSLFQSEYIQRFHAQNIPNIQKRLRHYLDDGGEKALLHSIKRYLDVTETNAKIREITKEVFDRMNRAAG